MGRMEIINGKLANIYVADMGYENVRISIRKHSGYATTYRVRETAANEFRIVKREFDPQGNMIGKYIHADKCIDWVGYYIEPDIRFHRD